MALTRPILRDKGITEKEILDFIMEEHGNAIESLKERHTEALDAVKEENKTLKDAAKNQPNVDADALTGEIAALKEQIETLKTDHAEALTAKEAELTEYKAGIEAKEVDGKKIEAIKEKLIADGARPSKAALKAMIGDIDLATVELDGGKIKNWDTVSAPIKEAYAEDFGEFKTQGVKVADPPASNTTTKDPFEAGFDGD